MLISFLLPTTTRLIFSTFPCLELDTGERWLLADKSIDCDSAAHARMVAYVCERSERWVASEGRDGSRAKGETGRERSERWVEREGRDGSRKMGRERSERRITSEASSRS
jgi:hypothetical protein